MLGADLGFIGAIDESDVIQFKREGGGGGFGLLGEGFGGDEIAMKFGNEGEHGGGEIGLGGGGGEDIELSAEF